jgi:hypothetical protein
MSEASRCIKCGWGHPSWDACPPLEEEGVPMKNELIEELEKIKEKIDSLKRIDRAKGHYGMFDWYNAQITLLNELLDKYKSSQILILKPGEIGIKLNKEQGEEWLQKYEGYKIRGGGFTEADEMVYNQLKAALEEVKK